MSGVGHVVFAQDRLLTDFLVILVQSGNSVKFVCQITPNAFASPVHPLPGGEGMLTPVLAAIISAKGKVPTVHCGGLKRSNVAGPPHSSTTMMSHSLLLIANWGMVEGGGLGFGTAGHGLKLSFPSEVPW